MRKTVGVISMVVALSAVLVAGRAHFVGTPRLIESGNTVSASGKVAGLGNVPQIHVEVTGDAQCVNPGGNDPQAGNKESFSVSGDFPVQNGKALFYLDLTATITPPCTPPMSIVWSDVEIIVTAADGTFLVYP